MAAEAQAGWRTRYLDLVAERPDITPQEAAEALGVDEEELRRWRRYQPEVRKAEDDLLARHRARQRLDRIRKDEEEIEDIPFRFGRFLDLFRDTKRRAGALQVMRSEGMEITWDEVMEAAGKYPSYRKALAAAMNEITLAIEDKNIEAALDGKAGAIRLHLQAKKPEEYAPRLRVTGSVTHQLAAEDRALIEEIKQRHIAPPKIERPPTALLERLAAHVAEGEDEPLDAEIVA